MSMNVYRGATRMTPYIKPTVWSLFTQLAKQTNSVNLGQGFPNWQPPDFFLESLLRRNQSGCHQYSRAYGHPPLVNAVSKHYSPIFRRNIDAMKEICVGNGAVSVLCAGFLSLVNPGDEVILFDPSYDCYRAQISFAGGVCRSVPLKAKRLISSKELMLKKKVSQFTEDDLWEIDWKLLENTINEKTKVVLINNPHNPTGKVFSQPELERISSILKKYPRVLVFEDGVYEHLTYDIDPFKLDRFAQIKDMWDRTISVYSAGKLFSATGIKIGWGIGPQDLINNLNAFIQYNTYCLHGPMQEAVADSLDIAEEQKYFDQAQLRYARNKELMIKQLVHSQLNLNINIPQGGYFILTDISNQVVSDNYFNDPYTGQKLSKDFAFCLQMAKELGVVAIPCSVFYGSENKHIGENQVRFAFCKVQEDIIEAGKRLSVGKQANRPVQKISINSPASI